MEDSRRLVTGRGSSGLVMSSVFLLHDDLQSSWSHTLANRGQPIKLALSSLSSILGSIPPTHPALSGLGDFLLCGQVFARIC